METKHTKGPWKAKESFLQDGFVILRVEPNRTKRLDDSNGRFSEADAKLIAAAPTLLAACHDALAVVRRYESYSAAMREIGRGDSTSNQDILHAGARIEAAILLAEGREVTG